MKTPPVAKNDLKEITTPPFPSPQPSLYRDKLFWYMSRRDYGHGFSPHAYSVGRSLCSWMKVAITRKHALGSWNTSADSAAHSLQIDSVLHL